MKPNAPFTNLHSRRLSARLWRNSMLNRGRSARVLGMNAQFNYSNANNRHKRNRLIPLPRLLRRSTHSIRLLSIMSVKSVRIVEMCAKTKRQQKRRQVIKFNWPTATNNDLPKRSKHRRAARRCSASLLIFSPLKHTRARAVFVLRTKAEMNSPLFFQRKKMREKKEKQIACALLSFYLSLDRK